MIFDKAFIEKLPNLNYYYNPHVVALCKMPHLEKLRQQIEAWFENIPTTEQADIKARLRSMDDGQHLGAFYEVMLHQFCLEEGWQTEMHHVLEGGLVPDLKLTTLDKQELLLEVYTQLDPEDERKLAIVKNKLNDVITKLDTPFLLNLTYKENPPLDLDLKSLKQSVQDWLNSLDQKSTEKFVLQLGQFGVNAKLTAQIKEGITLELGGRLFSVIGPTMSGLPGIDKVNNKLKLKRKKYNASKTTLPLVVAVCDGTSNSWWGEMTIDRALFGNHTITFALDGSDEEAQAGRDHKGLITPKAKQEGYFAENKGISAVLYCARVQDTRGDIRYHMLVFHNPWAYVPLPAGVFEKLPQLLITKNDETGVTLEWNKEDRGNFRVFFTDEATDDGRAETPTLHP